jgi:uncharacterized protein
MRDAFRYIFLTRHGEIRSGWKIMLFLIGIAALATGVSAVLHLFRIGIVLLDAVGFLATTLFVSWVLTRYVNRKHFAAIGLWFHPRAIREFGIGMLLGFLMMAGIFILLFAAGYAQVSWLLRTPGEMVTTVLYSFVFFAVAAAGEEVLFRGYVFQTMAQGITVLPAILVMSGIFGIAHAANPNANAFSIANVMLAGIWLSFAYLKTRGLWLPFGLHLAWNFSQTTVFGFPTSGITFADQKIMSTVTTGPDWITGGAFGPEGSLLATLALIGCTWYLLKSKYIAAPEGIVTLDSVEDIPPPPAVADGAGA